MPRYKRRLDFSRAVAYLRVSTGEQSLGPDAQLAAIQRWASNHSVTVIETCQDLGISGGSQLDQRPGLLAALRAVVMHRAGLIVVAKRDRLARDVVVAAAIERLAQAKGARVVSADGTSNADGPEGMLMRGLVDLFAQYERALIRTRTSAALGIKKARGERVGQVPYGFQLSEDRKRLQQDAAEQMAIARVRELRAQGFTLAAIADLMNEERMPARGSRWHKTTVARLLARDVA